MRTLLTFILLIFLILSCNKGSKELSKNNIKIKDTSLIIKYGKSGGWCVGDDSLMITNNDLYYASYSSCRKSQIVKHAFISTNDKATLLNSIDLKEFKKIEINTCNVCVDGIDYWISINHDSFTHRIRYGYDDTIAIAKIKIFISNLNKLKSQFD